MKNTPKEQKVIEAYSPSTVNAVIEQGWKVKRMVANRHTSAIWFLLERPITLKPAEE